MEFVERIEHVKARLESALNAAKRQPNRVTLLAVSKNKPAERLIQAYQAGLRHFGESYLQEALAKQRLLAHYNISWHFIGPIQSNKSALIANHFHWVHSVDRLKIARRLSQQRSPQLLPLNICLQVNISGEATKSGVALDELADLAAAVIELPNLKLRGVMAIPAKCDRMTELRASYRRVSVALEQLPWEGLDTLSMGMSGDLEAAIAEGSTIVRVGTALFGPRV